MLFFVAGKIFNNIGVLFFVAGAVFGGFWVDSPSANGRVRDNEFMVRSCLIRPRNVIDFASIFRGFLFD